MAKQKKKPTFKNPVLPPYMHFNATLHIVGLCGFRVASVVSESPTLFPVLSLEKSAR